jgi:ethanolamine utilization protein EutN
MVSTIKNSHLAGYKLLIVQPLNLNNQPEGASIIAVDKVDAGINDLVLVNKDGSSARTLLEDEKVPLQAVIVGVIDGVEIFDTGEGEKEIMHWKKLGKAKL